MDQQNQQQGQDQQQQSQQQQQNQQQGQDQQQQNQQQQTKPPEPWTPPADLPEQFRGADASETIGKMLPALTGFIKKNSERGSTPDKPDGYNWMPSDKLKDKIGDLSKDPVYPKAREAALAAELTDKQFQTFMDKLGVDVLADAPAAFKSEAETDEGLMRGNLSWIDNMKAQGRLTPAEVAEAEMLILTKGGSGILGKMQMGMTPGYVAAAGNGASGSFNVATPTTKADADKLVSDPRYMTDSKTYDPAFRKWAVDQQMRFASG
jgi:type II secretory pathway pseudopilin PulG